MFDLDNFTHDDLINWYHETIIGNTLIIDRKTFGLIKHLRNNIGDYFIEKDKNDNYRFLGHKIVFVKDRCCIMGVSI